MFLSHGSGEGKRKPTSNQIVPRLRADYREGSAETLQTGQPRHTTGVASTRPRHIFPLFLRPLTVIPSEAEGPEPPVPQPLPSFPTASIHLPRLAKPHRLPALRCGAVPTVGLGHGRGPHHLDIPGTPSASPPRLPRPINRLPRPRSGTYSKLPLPAGEGWGEGESTTTIPSCHTPIVSPHSDARTVPTAGRGQGADDLTSTTCRGVSCGRPMGRGAGGYGRRRQLPPARRTPPSSPRTPMRVRYPRTPITPNRQAHPQLPQPSCRTPIRHDDGQGAGTFLNNAIVAGDRLRSLGYARDDMCVGPGWHVERLG